MNRKRLVLFYAIIIALVACSSAWPLRQTPGRQAHLLWQSAQFVRLLRQGPHGLECLLHWGLGAQPIASMRAWRQRQADSCGVAALAAWSEAFATVDRDTLHAAIRLPTGGTNLRLLQQAAQRRAPDASLRVIEDWQNCPLPAIAHLRRRHFVVLYEVDAERVRIFDPACGSLWLRRDVFEEAASGAILFSHWREAV